MFGIEQKKDVMYLTRGDDMEFAVYYPIYDTETEEATNYVFQKGDKLTFVVKSKNGYTKEEVFRKDFIIQEETPYPEIKLSGNETKWGQIKNKKAVYWFDVVLNDTQTIMGYSDEGAAKIYLLPEASELHGLEEMSEAEESEVD